MSHNAAKLKLGLRIILLSHLLVGSDLTSAMARSFCSAKGGATFVDTSSPVNEKFVSKLAAIGVDTIARYYDYPDETLPGKRLRKEELPLLQKYQIKLLVVFQHYNNKKQTFLNWKTRGPKDAAEALNLAGSIGQPKGSAIYFGVDGDFVGGKKTSDFIDDDVKSYFLEIRRVFLADKAPYDIGVYGSGATCKLLISQKLAKYCWISQSSGFVGTKEAIANGEYHVRQFLPEICAGRSVDFNLKRSSTSQYGQFAVK